jgi:hypothetical protein
VRESDYINASELAVVRAAQAVLRGGGLISKSIPEDEQRHVMRCLTTWIARLEVAIGAKSKDSEPELLEFPKWPRTF